MDQQKNLLRIALWSVFLLLLVSCASGHAKYAYEWAQRDNTSETWKYFLKLYPKSEFAETARARIAELEKAEREADQQTWERANKKIDEIVGGDRSRIQPGSQFPVHRFLRYELLQAMGKYTCSTLSNPNPPHFAVQTCSMESPVGESASGKLSFFPKGTSRPNRLLVLMIGTGKMVNKEFTDIEITIEGMGFAVVSLDDATVVYEFSSDPTEAPMKAIERAIGKKRK